MVAVIEHSTLVARRTESAQTIVLRPAVLEHLARYNQINWWKCEAGGQLFASLTDAYLDVSQATGPYRGDFRSRFGYRSKPTSAQREIQRQRDLGLYYCGDWHTHPQQFPRASGEDFETIVKLQVRSDLRLGAVLMVIQGTAPGAAGLAVYVCNGGRVVQWSVEELGHDVPHTP